jgi:hypothetical protein
MYDMLITGHLKSDDPNAELQLDFGADLSDERKKFDLDLDMSLLNLYALHFSSDKVALTTKMSASAKYTKMDDLGAQVQFSSLNIFQDGTIVPLNSALLITELTPDSTYLSIRSDPLNVELKSNISSVELGPVLQSAIRKYLGLTDTVGLPTDKNITYEIKFNKDDRVILPLLPEVKELVVDNFSGSYSSNNNRLVTKVAIPKIIYNDMMFDSVTLSLLGLEDSLSVRAGFNKLSIGSSSLKHLLVKAAMHKGEITSGLRVGEDISSTKFYIKSEMAVTDDGFRVSILPEGLIFDSKQWKVPPDNFLMKKAETISSGNFSFSSEDQHISINVKEDWTDLEFNNFNIGNLINILSYGNHKQLMHGGLDGKVSISTDSNTGHFVADLQFNHLYLLDTLIGNLKVRADYTDDLLDLNLIVDNQKNKINLSGNINQKTEKYDLKAIVDFTDLSRLERFTMGELTEMSGAVNSNFALKGSFDNPELQGLISFNDVCFNIKKLNFKTTLKNESLRFDKKGIHFDNFIITDEAQKELEVNGLILTENYTDFAFDLRVHANKFQPVNSTKNDNHRFFGSLVMDTDLKIKGDMDLPRVEANLKIDKGTNLTYVLPGSKIKLISSEGTVNFTNPNLAFDTLFTKETDNYFSDSIISRIHGIYLSANFQLEPEASFTLFIDPVSGDYITVGGKANLNVSIDESGTQSVTGIFEVSEGFYQISFYGLVKKSFTIDPGSNIAWSGRPMDANLNITARHIVRCSSTALVANESTSLSQAELNMFKTRLPYEVLLHINGFLTEPKVSFNIDLSDKYLINYPIVASKLAKLNTPEMQSELNKQVFALLVAGTFIADNPLSSTGNSADNIATTAARNSVNGILADQLNNISSQYIKNIDLNFGLTTYDDYSSGSGQTRTELDVQVSKKFFDERLAVEATGVFDLEGDSKKFTGQTSQHMYGEFSVTYDLTESREYKIRAFRENAYDIFDGEVAYSGLALIFEKSFDQFRKKDKKKKSKNKRKNNKKRPEKEQQKGDKE